MIGISLITRGYTNSPAPNSTLPMLPPPSRCRRPPVPRPPTEAREGLLGGTVHLHGAPSGIGERARHRTVGAAAWVSCAWYISTNLRCHRRLGVDSDATVHSFRAAAARRSQGRMVNRFVVRKVGVVTHSCSTPRAVHPPAACVVVRTSIGNRRVVTGNRHRRSALDFLLLASMATDRCFLLPDAICNALAHDLVWHPVESRRAYDIRGALAVSAAAEACDPSPDVHDSHVDAVARIIPRPADVPLRHLVVQDADASDASGVTAGRTPSLLAGLVGLRPPPHTNTARCPRRIAQNRNRTFFISLPRLPFTDDPSHFSSWGPWECGVGAKNNGGATMCSGIFLDGAQ